MDLNGFFQRVEQATGARTQVQLANLLNIRQSSISDAKRRGSIPDTWLLALYDKFKLNPDWLRTGEGSQLLKQADGEKEVVQVFRPEPLSTIGQASRAAAVVARAVRLGATCLGMMSENLHRYATQNSVAYGDDAFERQIRESGCLESDIQELMNMEITTTKGPEHGGHAEAEATETAQEAQYEGSLRQEE